MSIQVTVMSIDFDSFEEPITKVFHKNEITVGRKLGNDLVLDRPEVSSCHAKLVVKKNGSGDELKLYVMDMGSSNGTMLERDSLAPEKEIPIQSNQRLIIGSYLLKPSVIGGLVEESELDETPAVSEGEGDSSRDAATSTVIVSKEEREALLGVGSEKDSDSDAVTREMPIRQLAGEEATGVEQIQVESPPLVEAQLEAARPAAGPPSEVLATHFAATPPPVLTLKLDADAVLDLDFIASQLFRVSGRVLHKGKPLAGVRIDGGELGETATSSDGRFNFADIVEGTAYRIGFELKGYVLEPSVLSGTVEGDASLDVTATKLFELRGKVLHRGKPLAGVEITAGALGSAITSIDGSFSFKEIRDGTKYEIHAAKDRFLFDGDRKGSVERDTDVTFEARQLLRIGGRVVHKGKPLAGVEIECINLGKTTTDEQGNYVFDRVPEGAEYTFTASKPGFRLSHTRTVQ